MNDKERFVPSDARGNYVKISAKDMANPDRVEHIGRLVIRAFAQSVREGGFTKGAKYLVIRIDKEHPNGKVKP